MRNGKYKMTSTTDTYKIRTHLEQHGLKLDIIDRKAIVEFFLIEDLYALVEFNMEKILYKIESGLSDSLTTLQIPLLLEGYKNLSRYLSILIDFLGHLIYVARYDIVRKSINESLIRRSISKLTSSKQINKLNFIILETLDVAIHFAFDDNVFNDSSLELEKEIKEILEKEKLKFNFGSKRKNTYEGINHSNNNNLEDIMEKLWKLYRNEL